MSCSWCGIEISREMLERATHHHRRIVLIDGKAHLVHVEHEKQESQDEVPANGEENDNTVDA